MKGPRRTHMRQKPFTTLDDPREGTVDTIVLPDQPIPLDNLTDRRIADLVDLAASLIERDGLEHGDMWKTGLLLDYREGIPCSAEGALAVACGYRNARQVEAEFFGLAASYDVQLGYNVKVGPHPVLAALMREMCCVEIEQLFDWSDSVRQDQAVARLRQAAAAMRIRSADVGVTQVLLAAVASSDLGVEELNDAMPHLRDIATAMVDHGNRPVTA